MNSKIIAPALLALLATLSISSLSAEERRGGPGGKPPTEAIEACTDKAAEESCSFTSPRGDITGTCRTPPRGEEALACVPEGGRPPRGEKSE